MKDVLPLVRTLRKGAESYYTQKEAFYIVAKREPIDYDEVGHIECVDLEFDWTEELTHALKFETKDAALEWVEYERMNEPKRLIELFGLDETFCILKVEATATFIREATKYVVDGNARKEAR